MSTPPPVTMRDLLLRRSADKSTGLRFADESWTWAEHVRLSARRATLLGTLLPADRPRHVGVLMENGPEFSFLLGAAALSGIVVVGLNPTRRGAELARDIEHTDCALVITDGTYEQQVREAAPAVRLLNIQSDEWATSLTGEGIRAEDLNSHIENSHVEPGDTFMLILTSGTTGHPKAVISTQGRMARQGNAVTQMMKLTGEDVVYCAMPLFHSNAMVTAWTPALDAGATLVVRPKFSASGFLTDVRRYGATYANYVGKPLAYILATPERPDDADNTLTRVFGNEGGPQDVQRFGQRFGCTVRDGFGSTEGGLTFTPVPDMPNGALGKPRGDIRILNADTGEECPPARFDAEGRLVNADEAVGELVNMEGPGGFEGYYNNPSATEDRMRGGRYWSGDLAYKTEAGLVFFAGRSGEWIRVAGENFGAAPVAAILNRHPDVAIAAVYGVPDDAAGDQAMAALVLRGGVDFDPSGFADWLAAQPDMSPTWHPRYVRIAAELPQTQTHKVLSRVLAREAWRTAGVWWRSGKTGAYGPFTDADRKQLEASFTEHGRGHVLDLLT